MKKPNFLAMTRTELRKYILDHREDEEAFQIYVDRFKSENNEVFPAPKTIEDLQNFPELQRQHQQQQNQG